MQLLNFFAQDVNGNVVPGAACTIFISGTSTLATGLQDASGAPLSNPFNANSVGLVSVAAPQGIYDIQMVSGLLNYTIKVQFIDAAQVAMDATSASASAASAAASAASVLGVLGTLQPLIAPGSTGQFYAWDKTFKAVTNADVGLGNVDNTSDASKPVSTAQLLALGLKIAYSLSVAALRTSTDTSSFISTSGYYLPGDGGGSDYYYDSSDSTSSDDGFMVIVRGDSRRYKLIHNGLVSLKQAGAYGDGATDDSARIQVAVNAAAASGFCIGAYGRFKMSSTVTLPQSVTISGGSQFNDAFIPGTASMTMFSQVFSSSSASQTKIEKVAFDCGAVADVRCLYFKNSNRTYVDNIAWIGALTNIEFDLGGFLSVTNSAAQGNATNKTGQMKLWSSDDTKYGSVFSNVSNYRIENNGQGVVSPAIYNRRAVGVKFDRIITTNNAAHGNGTCILFENDCQGCTVSDSLIVDYDLGVVFQQGSGVANSPIANMLEGVDFDQCRTNAILHSSGSGNSIRGGVITSSFISTTIKCISVQPGSVNLKISGTKVSGYFGSGGGAVILNGTAGTRISDVEVDACDQGFTFVGTQTRLDIYDCDLSSSVTSPLVNSFAGATNSVRTVKGYSAASLITSPAVPATTVAITNTYAVRVRVFINGGTVNTVSINGASALFTTGAMLVLEPGETIAMSYSAAPTWNWIGI